ncbi:MAG TPA: CRISPR-associated endonuclease Cas2 [Lentisphaeria bacterium]|nr:MAG: CRISPR-associated endonuclease Cas2 [Lentisphaerae bacterium GWF2_49_21]HBC89778.1 CRISPR-associated endonuclease Cas2 [Lentisphaeria bacterium]
MLVLVSYDMKTSSKDGQKRLRRVAKVCLDYGQRVQNSVFECLVDQAQFTVLKKRLLDEIDEDQDSLRFYFLGNNWYGKVEHIGAKPTVDLEGSLIV